MVKRIIVLAFALAACAPFARAAETAAPAAALSDADVQYYADFASAAKRVGGQLDKLGDLLAKTAAGKDYSSDCEDRAREFADAYHFLETLVPPGDALTAHKGLMASAELGSQSSLELASYFDAEFKHKEKVTKALDLYDHAVTKYADALGATPVDLGGK